MNSLSRRVFLGLVLAFVGVPLLHAEDLYQPLVFQNAKGEKLGYRLMAPQGYDPKGTEKYPLVLFLHGAGERGDDNTKQLIHGTSDFAKPENRAKYPAFVVVPQCPEGKRWVEVDWTLDAHKQLPEDSETMQLVLQLIDRLRTEQRIDPQRLYVTGLSMGGYGTWDLITRHPQMWAAAAPICAGGDEATAARAAHIPVWAFHGDQDTVVKPHRSRNMVMALQKAGGEPRYTEYPGVAHNSWQAAYSDPKLLEWMFAQKRK